MSFASSDPHVSSLDEKPLTGYRGISVAAVMALILGFASALALVHPFLWVVPLITVATAIWALRSINVEGSNLTGRGLALTGLAIAIIFGLWAPTRVVSRQRQLYHQAHVFAETWLDLVRAGKLQEAHQLTLPHAERQLPETVLATVYTQSEDLQNKYKSFYKAKPAKTMAAALDKATYTYTGGDGIPPREFKTEQVALRYDMQYEEAGQQRRQSVRIVLERSETEARKFQWRVREVVDPNRVDS